MSVTTIEKLVKKSIDFHTRAKAFKDRGELEGALINFMLSADNLETALGESQNLRAAVQKQGRDPKKLQEINSWCDQKCEEFRHVLKRLLSEIVPLQEELKKRKSFRISGGGGNDDITSCANVRQLILEKQDCVFFDNIVGQQEAKDALEKLFILPLAFPNLYPRRAQGILLYGLPGTGKTQLAKAAASELQIFDKNINVLFFAPTPDKLKGKFVGETEKNIAAFFDCASQKAKQCQQENPDTKVISIIFFDELDSIASKRGGGGLEGQLAASSVNILLQKMQGISSQDDVAVIGATNFPDVIDSAVMRRFDRRIHVELPTEEDKVKIVEKEIDNYIRLDPSRFQELSATIPKRQTQSKKLVCAPQCTRPIIKTLYTDPLYKSFVSITKQDIETVLRDIDLRFGDIKVSQSDIVSWTRKAFVKVAERARERGLFSKINLRDTEGNLVQVFMSLDILEALKANKNKTEEDLEVAQSGLGVDEKGHQVFYSKIPEIIQIKLNGILLPSEENQNVFFQPGVSNQFYHHRIVFKDDDFIFNFPIQDIYVQKDNLSNSFQFLLSIPIKILPNNSSTLYLLSKFFTANDIKALIGKAVSEATEAKRTQRRSLYAAVKGLFVSPEDAVPSNEEIASEVLNQLLTNQNIIRVMETENPESTLVVSTLTTNLIEIIKSGEVRSNESTVLDPNPGISESIPVSDVIMPLSINNKNTESIRYEQNNQNIRSLYENLRNNTADTFQEKRKLISWAITRNDFDQSIDTSISQTDISRIENFINPREA